jgi:hypothetical protein
VTAATVDGRRLAAVVTPKSGAQTPGSCTAKAKTRWSGTCGTGLGDGRNLRFWRPSPRFRFPGGAQEAGPTCREHLPTCR